MSELTPITSNPTSDFVTILACEPGRRAAKRYTDLAQAPEDYDAGTYFTPIVQNVGGLKDLAVLLGQLRRLPNAFVVRGRVKPGTPPGLIARRKHDREGQPAALEAAAHHWVALDADETSTPFDSREPRGSIERWRASLPEGLQNAECVFHFSAKQHQKSNVRGRAWFWSERPLTDEEGDAWATANGLDPATFRTVQPIYTSDPVFDGCSDPLDRELVHLDGALARFELATDALVKREPYIQRASGQHRGLFHAMLAERGDVVRENEPGKWTIVCPRENEHSSSGGSGTVLWAPREGQELGFIHCTHTSHGHDKLTAKEWLACFDDTEVAAANAVLYPVIAGLAARPVTLQPSAPRIEVVAAMPAANANAPRNPWPTIDVAGIFEPLGPVDFVIEALDICVGAPALIAGYGFSAKSISTQEICLAIASGDRAFGLFPVKRGRTIYLDREQGPRLTRERFQRLARARGLTAAALGDRLQIVSMPPIGLDSPNVESFLVDKFAGVTLTVIDSLKAFAPTIDENSSDMRAPLDMLTRISLNTGCAFVVIHHARKPNAEQRGGARMSIRGSAAIYDGCSSVLVFEGAPGEKTRVSHQKARNSGQPHDPFTLHVEDVAFGIPGADISYQPRWGVRVVGQLQGADAPDSKQLEVAEAVAKLKPKVLAWLKDNGATRAGKGKRSEIIATGIGARRAFVDLALDALEAAEAVELEKHGNAKLWALCEPRPAAADMAPPGDFMPAYDVPAAPSDAARMSETLERIAGVS